MEQENKIKYTTRHMCMSIKGCLNNYKRRSLKGLMTDDDGRELSDFEARQYLHECLEKGWRVIPMSSKCEGFDYQTGCPGHESTKEHDPGSHS